MKLTVNLASESLWTDYIRLCSISVAPITQLRMCVIQGRSPNLNVVKVISMP